MSLEEIELDLKGKILSIMGNEEMTIIEKLKIIENKITSYEKIKEVANPLTKKEIVKMLRALIACRNVMRIIDESGYKEKEAYSLLTINCWLQSKCNSCDKNGCVKVCKSCNNRFCEKCECLLCK